jgi:hypothetical protein
MFWTPAFTGVTLQDTFYEILNPEELVKCFFRNRGSYA